MDRAACYEFAPRANSQGDPRSDPSCRAGEAAHGMPVLAVHDRLGRQRLRAAVRAAQGAYEGATLVAVDALAGERSAPAVGALVAISRQLPQALAQKLAFEVVTWSGHGGVVRRPDGRSFRENVSTGLVKNAVYVRIRTNYAERRRGAGGSGAMESLMSGTLAGTGSFRCEECGYVVTLSASDTLPDCPGCGGSTFARASLFGATRFPRQSPRPSEQEDRESWLARARAQAEHPGAHLAYADGDRIVVVPLTREWTRIGRSLAADVRFDDPTVSRRHALIVRQADGVRVLDDRSLNGVFVNGERVDWRGLHDGDEIVVGRYRLTYLEVAEVILGALDELEATS
jgi:hypothetical protein